MVASQASMTRPPETPESIVREMSEHLVTLAEAGDWEEVERITARLRGAVMNVPEERRRSVVIALQRSLQKVAETAAASRQGVRGRLSELRRGQAATKAYDLR